MSTLYLTPQQGMQSFLEMYAQRLDQETANGYVVPDNRVFLCHYMTGHGVVKLSCAADQVDKEVNRAVAQAFPPVVYYSLDKRFMTPELVGVSQDRLNEYL